MWDELASMLQQECAYTRMRMCKNAHVHPVAIRAIYLPRWTCDTGTGFDCECFMEYHTSCSDKNWPRRSHLGSQLSERVASSAAS